MSNQSYGTLYWTNPVTHQLEFLLGEHKDHPHQFDYFKFTTYKQWYDDLMGIRGPIDLLNNKAPNYLQKTTHESPKIYYLHTPNLYTLSQSLQGFRDYLNHCKLAEGIQIECKSFTQYTGFKLFTQSEIVNLPQTSVKSFTLALPILKNMDLPVSPEQLLSGQKLLAQILKKQSKMSGKNDPEYVKKLAQEHAQYYESLKSEYQQAVQYYTGQGSVIMNQYLRGQLSPSHLASYPGLIEKINQLNQVLANAPPTTKPITVYRGLKIDNEQQFYNLKPGQIIDLFRDGFNSTSFSLSVSAGNHFTQSQCCIFVITLPPGVRGLYIGTKSGAYHEDEFILAPGPYFRVFKLPGESIPFKGLYPSKPDMRYYRLMCENCTEAYAEYHNKVYYHLIGPALTLGTMPANLKEPTPGLISLPNAKHLIMPQKMKVPETKPIDSHFIVKYSKNVAQELTQLASAFTGAIDGPVMWKGYPYIGNMVAGKPEGKGKYTYPGLYTYEGEWINGFKYGQGKMTDLGGYGYSYEGLWKSDYPDGKGKQILSNGTIYEGNFINGTIHGLGYQINPSGDIYQGTFTSGKLNGSGTATISGQLYTCTFQNGVLMTKHKIEGNYGELILDSGTYQGQVYQNKAHGKGRLNYSYNGETYVGSFLDNLPHGQGTLTTSVWIYTGMFEKGKAQGQAQIKFLKDDINGGFKTGDVYTGMTENTGLYGLGVLVKQNGDVYEGNFIGYGIPSGNIKITYSNGQIYEGDYNPLYHLGYGVLTWPNGNMYEGQYNGLGMNGYGQLKSAKKSGESKGEILEGIFVTGKKHGNFHLFKADNTIWKQEYNMDILLPGQIQVQQTVGTKNIKAVIGGTYTGQLIENVAHGVGKLIHSQISYLEGYFYKDRLNGVGLYVDDLGNQYKGRWIQGIQHGKFVQTSPNGKMYEFEVWKGIKTKDIEIKAKPAEIISTTLPNLGSYKGTLINNQPEGQGTLTYDTGDVYEGQFSQGKPHGKGKMVQDDGDIYVGDFVKGKMEGHGIYTYTTGQIYTGQFADGTMDGQGTMKDPVGNMYEGGWALGLEHGSGIVTDLNSGQKFKVTYSMGQLVNQEPVEITQVTDFKLPQGGNYTGSLMNQIPEGPGTIKYENGDVVKGKFKNGQLQDWIIITKPDGQTIKGQSADGHLKQGTLTWSNGMVYSGSLALINVSTYVPQGQGSVKTLDLGTLTGIFTTDSSGNVAVVDQTSQQTYALFHQLATTYDGNYAVLTTFKGPVTTLLTSQGVKFELPGKHSGLSYFGKMLYKDHSVYEGRWLGDVPHGLGILTTPEGIEYKGLFDHGSKHGFFEVVDPIKKSKLMGYYVLGHLESGTLTLNTGDSYQGKFKNEQPHGMGTWTYPTGDSYTGLFEEGQKHGLGIYKNQKGDVFTAEYKHDKEVKLIPKVQNLGLIAGLGYYKGLTQNGKPHGQGQLVYPNGDEYTGEFQHGLPGPKGILKPKSGSKIEVSYNDKGQIISETVIPETKKLPQGTYVGTLVDGMPQGQGTLTYNWGGQVYTGEFNKGIINGVGQMKFKGGKIYKGAFKDGQLHGSGELIYPDGTIKDVVYSYDMLVSEKSKPSDISVSTSTPPIAPSPASISEPISKPEPIISPAPVTLVSSHFDAKSLNKVKDILNPEILQVLHLWAKDAPLNKFISPKTQKPVALSSPTAKIIIQELMTPPTLPSIDPKYLKNLPLGVLIQLVPLTENCPPNKIQSLLNKKSCIAISSKTGQAILKELENKLQIQ